MEAVTCRFDFEDILSGELSDAPNDEDALPGVANTIRKRSLQEGAAGSTRLLDGANDQTKLCDDQSKTVTTIDTTRPLQVLLVPELVFGNVRVLIFTVKIQLLSSLVALLYTLDLV